MRCARCQALLSSLLDGDLGEKRARAVDQHLADCRACRVAYGELRALSACFQEMGLDEEKASGGGQEPALAGAELSRASNLPGAPDAVWARIEAGLDADERRERARARAIWRSYRHLAPATVALLLGGGLVGGAAVRHVQAAQRSASADRELLRQTRTALEKVEVTELASIGELRAMANADRAGWSETERARRDEEFFRLERALDESRAAVEGERRPSLATAERLQADYRAEIAFFERALAPTSPRSNEGPGQNQADNQSDSPGAHLGGGANANRSDGLTGNSGDNPEDGER